MEIRIRERAYQLWIEQGSIGGQADYHWLAAEREVLNASMAALTAKPATAKKAPRSSARATPTLKRLAG